MKLPEPIYSISTMAKLEVVYHAKAKIPKVFIQRKGCDVD
jgi:hypothetical protein